MNSKNNKTHEPGPKLGHLIRKRRKKLGLTLKALSDATQVSVGYLSQLERDLAAPTLATLSQIASGLDATLEYFVAAPKWSTQASRAGQRVKFSIPGAATEYEAVSAKFPGAELCSYIIHYPVGYVSETASHEGEEILFVLEGELEQVLGEETFLLKAGDSLHYDGTVPHSCANRSSSTVRVLWTGTLNVFDKMKITGALP